MIFASQYPVLNLYVIMIFWENPPEILFFGIAQSPAQALCKVYRFEIGVCQGDRIKTLKYSVCSSLRSSQTKYSIALIQQHPFITWFVRSKWPGRHKTGFVRLALDYLMLWYVSGGPGVCMSPRRR